MRRHLYLLKRIGEAARPGLDEQVAVVVRAKTEDEARLYAESSKGDEGKIWTRPDLVSCDLLTNENGDSGMVIQDFRNG